MPGQYSPVPTSPVEPLLPVNDVAEILKRSRTFVYELVHAASYTRSASASGSASPQTIFGLTSSGWKVVMPLKPTGRSTTRIGARSR
jgi:hypothetical protein